MAVRITVEEAGDYFSDPSQQLHGITQDNLPDHGFEYWAEGPVCGIFHRAAWPDVYMCHYGVKADAWGKLDAFALDVLADFWDDKQAARLIGWTPSTNKAALAFSERLGFVVDGEMDLGSETIIMQGWTKWQ